MRKDKWELKRGTGTKEAGGKVLGYIWDAMNVIQAGNEPDWKEESYQSVGDLPKEGQLDKEISSNQLPWQFMGMIYETMTQS